MNKPKITIKEFNYYTKSVFKGVLTKGIWKRILWQEFDSKQAAINHANRVLHKEYS